MTSFLVKSNKVNNNIKYKKKKKKKKTQGDISEKQWWD